MLHWTLHAAKNLARLKRGLERAQVMAFNSAIALRSPMFSILAIIAAINLKCFLVILGVYHIGGKCQEIF